MENDKKNGRGVYERDLLRKVVRDYKSAIAEVRSKFDRLISGALSGSGRKPVKIQPPDFVQIVLIPIVRRLAEMMPEYEVELRAKEEIEPDEKGFFHIKIGGHIVAGICFGGVDAGHIKIGLFPSKRLWGRAFDIRSMNEMRTLVETVIQILDIPKRAQTDENDQ